MKILVLSPANKGVRNIVRDLVYGCWCGGRRIGGTQMPPLNLLYVAAVLKKSGHDVTFIDAGIDYASYERIKRDMTGFGAVIILSSTNTFKIDVESLREIKALHPDIKTMVFGSHPTFMPAYCLKEESIDIIVRREPEFIIRDLVNAFEKGKDWGAVRGIGYRKNGAIVLNEFYPFIEDLDELPVPDRGMLSAGIDYFNPLVKRMPYTTMQTSRGCPGRCIFCTVPSFYGKKIRCRSAGNVVREIKSLRDAGYKEIFFRDESFTVYKQRNTEICETLIRDKVDVTWICNARVDTIDEADVALMKKAGCHMIKFGVESGCQKILDGIRKEISLDETRRSFEICRKAGMDTHAHVMLGCPEETIESIKETVRFVKEIDPLTASFGITTPYPGTELFERVAAVHPEIRDGAEAGMERLHVNGFFSESYTGMDGGDLRKSVSAAYRAFYFRPRYLFRRILAIDSFGELMRWAAAGSNIFSFGMTSRQ